MTFGNQLTINHLQQGDIDCIVCSIWLEGGTLCDVLVRICPTGKEGQTLWGIKSVVCILEFSEKEWRQEASCLRRTFL